MRQGLGERGGVGRVMVRVSVSWREGFWGKKVVFRRAWRERAIWRS